MRSARPPDDDHCPTGAQRLVSNATVCSSRPFFATRPRASNAKAKVFYTGSTGGCSRRLRHTWRLGPAVLFVSRTVLQRPESTPEQVFPVYHPHAGPFGTLARIRRISRWGSPGPPVEALKRYASMNPSRAEIPRFARIGRWICVGPISSSRVRIQDGAGSWSAAFDVPPRRPPTRILSRRDCRRAKTRISPSAKAAHAPSGIARSTTS